MVAAYYGRAGCVRMLAGEEAGMHDKYNWTALMFAAYSGHLECVKILVSLEKGMRSNDGWNALIAAAKNGSFECVEILAPLEKGMRNKDGWTALMIAGYHANLKCVKVLAGEEAEMRDHCGRTAMMKSAEKGEVVSFLSPFEAGIADSKGMNQTCYAIDRSADPVAAIRLEKTAGWLLDGKTILEAEIGRRQKSLFEAERRQIQRNPLWKREVQLAESQRERP